MLENFPSPLFIVGGWVRDKLLGLEPKDIDLASALLPNEVMKWADTNGIPAKMVNENHLVVSLTVDDVRYEHTTFRVESDFDGIHAHCEPVRELYQDLQRRDFTINALAYPYLAIDREFNRNLVTGVEGWEEDLENRVLRIVCSDKYGSELNRLEQSGNRYFRAIRFAVKYKLNIDLVSFQALRRFTPFAFDYSNAEAFREEWEKCGYSYNYIIKLKKLGFFINKTPISEHRIAKRYPWWHVLRYYLGEENALNMFDMFAEKFKLPRKVKGELWEILYSQGLENDPVTWHMYEPKRINKYELLGMHGVRGVFLREDLLTLSDFFQSPAGQGLTPDEIKTIYKNYLQEAYWPQ